MNHRPPQQGVPDLGARPQIIVARRTILFPSLVELHDGGMAIPGCDVHLEVLDVINGRLYYVPMQEMTAHKLGGAIDHYRHDQPLDELQERQQYGNPNQ